ncbi:MAG TPA: NAD(P)H-binding protein [Streptosporangiaceae bacterium]|nr:NAD(P)H-binding protein [Streptosporangiaceae bacterium]
MPRHQCRRPSIAADFGDPGPVAAAMTDVDHLFLNTAGAGPADGEQPMVRQQRTVIDAARDAGVSQIVKVSVWGARRAHSTSSPPPTSRRCAPLSSARAKARPRVKFGSPGRVLAPLRGSSFTRIRAVGFLYDPRSARR